MKKSIFFVLVILLIAALGASSLPVYAYTPDFDIRSKSVILANADNGEVLFTRNENEKMYPASLTKIMTAVLAIESTTDLDAEMVTAPDYIFNELVGTNSSTADIRRGETMSMRQMLACLLVQSANEAALIIADHVAGGVDEFVDKMNKKAEELGMTGTHYLNPHGLHEDGHYTTAADMYKLTNYAMKYPEFCEIVASSRYQIPATNKHTPRILVTTNRMMDRVNGGKYYYGAVNGTPIIRGIKTGYTSEAGRNLISLAKKDGSSFLCIVLGAPAEDENGRTLTENYSFEDTIKLLDWAYNDFSYKEILSDEAPIAEIKLELAKDKDSLKLVPEKSVSSYIPKEAEASSVFKKIDLISESVDAPIQQGDVLGTVTLMLADQELATVNLVAAESVEKNEMLSVIRTLKNALSSIWFKIAAAAVILLILAYIAFSIYYNRVVRRRRAKQRSRSYRRYDDYDPFDDMH